MGIYAFSSADARVDSEFKPLPDGEYLMSIDHAEILETKSGLGEHLKLELVVLDSPDGFNHNRRVFQYHMIRHDNESSQRIGREMIQELGRASGLPEPMNIQDTSQFVNKSVRCKLKFKKGSEGYDDGNEVERYFAYQDTKQTASKPSTEEPAPEAETVKDDIPF